MIVTKKAIPRRTVLRGIGATLALPLLDSMVPALTALERTPAKPIIRFGVAYVPNGIMMQNWTPVATGSGFEFTPILKPLEPFRDRLLVVSGLRQGGPPAQGVHARASTKFLTNVSPALAEGSVVHAGISMDQIAAKAIGQQTQLASLEVALEATQAGTCDPGFACAYTDTISWRTESTPLPMENNPRAVFERLFGDAGTTDPQVRLARAVKESSLLDSVTDKIAHLQRGLGASDRSKLSEYLEAVRDVERRIQQTEAQNSRELPALEQPAGIPTAFADHAQLMFDLQLLAYQTDLTRIITFMIGREFSGHTYPEIGVPDAHHPTSHHQNDPEKLAKLTKINTYHVQQFAKYVQKLNDTPDGDGSLLDHVILVYGAGMSDGNGHSPVNLPILVLGTGAHQLKGGLHVPYPPETPLGNLHLTILDKLGVHIDTLSDSTGELSELSV